MSASLLILMPRNANPFPNFDDGLPKGFWHRLLENPENPLGWSVRMFTLWGIAARIHLLTVVYILGQLLWSIPTSHGGIMFVLPAMAALFVIVLAHEFGHCIACRRWGGEADRIVMLPWGGLALTRPRNDWRAHFGTTAGGPLVNLLLLPVLAAGLWLVGARDAILFNPFSPFATISTISGASSAETLFKVSLWWFHYVNLVILGFNLLLPMYPFDGGRLIQALLWRNMGYGKSMHISVLVGFGGAMVLGIGALIVEKAMLVLIAVFGAVSCWTELRRLRGEADLVTGEFGGGVPGGMPGGGGIDPLLAPPSRAEIRKAEAEAKREEAESKAQAEIDRILAKIAGEGMDSLSRGERKTLERETAKKKKG